MQERRRTMLQTISKYETDENKEFPRWIEQGMDQGVPTIYDNVIMWVRNPRRRIRRKSKAMKNINCVLNKFSEIVKQFTPDDLSVDNEYDRFIGLMQNKLINTDIMNSTIDSYLQIFHNKILVHGGVPMTIISDIKSDIRFIRKEMKLSLQFSNEITDEELEKWLTSLDELCNDPEKSPNLCRIANQNSTMATPEKTSLKHLLAVRAYIWLCLITAGRADEVRRIKIEDIKYNIVTRHITKMRIYSEPITTNIPEFAWKRISPYVDYVRNYHPNSELLFSENENRTGKGTISPKTLRELVKGSMIHANLGPTCAGGYYRTHDLRTVWSRWIEANQGSIEQTSALLGHKSVETTAKHYIGDTQKRSQRSQAEEKGHKQIQELLRVGSELTARVEELRRTFADLRHVMVHDDGSLSWPYMGGHDECAMNFPDDLEMDTSGLRFKSGSGDLATYR